MEKVKCVMCGKGYADKTPHTRKVCKKCHTLEYSDWVKGLDHPDWKPDWGVSPTELAVLRLIAIGKSYKEVAQELHCGYGTVCTHMAHMRVRAGVNSAIGLIAAAREKGIL